jgi:hypothetical protein
MANWLQTPIENFMLARKQLPVLLALLCLHIPATWAEDVSTNKYHQIAEEAYIYAFPLVMNYGTMFQGFINRPPEKDKTPFNQIYSLGRVCTPKDRTVVTPNSDTPYSSAYLDLRAEPVVLTVPEVEKRRYYSMHLIDLYTFNYGYVGTRTTGNGPGNYLIVGPSWRGDKPEGISKVFHCETDFSFVLFRTQLFSPSDIEQVKSVQSGYRAQPLSTFLGSTSPAASKVPAFPSWDPKAAFGKDFIRYLNFVLQFCPEPFEEKALRARFAKIGIGSGQEYDFNKLTKDQQAAIEKGIVSGIKKIEAKRETIGRIENGWSIPNGFGSRAFINGDWAFRATAAKFGIYGLDQVEAMYPWLRTDSNGEQLDGSRDQFTLTFAKGQLPPVNAFWSVTMYEAKTRFLIENPIDRYLINSPMLPDLKTNEDGSITLYVQKDSPGKDRESNWLPAPDGPFYLVMRLYLPKDEALEGKWKPPAIQRQK